VTDVTSGLIFSAAMWIAAIGGMLLLRSRAKTVGAGLVLAYVINLWLIHWPGAVIYTLPWYTGSDAEMVEAGFRQSAYGIVAFAVGTCVLAPLLETVFRGRRTAVVSEASGTAFARAYLLTGCLCYFVLSAVLNHLPTVTALVSTGWNLIAAGLCLSCWQAWQNRRSGQMFRWLSATLVLPLVTILVAGFAGYGAALAIAVLSFVAGFYRPRWQMVAATILLAYVGLSFYVTYMRDRDAIREVVWGQNSLAVRVSQLEQTLGSAEWFDLSNEMHLNLIDSRLNQNRLVGDAVYYLDNQMIEYARGETVWQAILALVPRALWQNKPVEAGSPGIVSYFTGLTFDQSTSVGVGHVMEFYINFGSLGVWLGFGLLGILLATVDRRASEALLQRNWAGFASWYLPGFSLLQVGGSLVELTASAAAALVVALLLNAVVKRWVTHG
jgi:hypothetical protein